MAVLGPKGGLALSMTFSFLCHSPEPPSTLKAGNNTVVTCYTCSFMRADL